MKYRAYANLKPIGKFVKSEAAVLKHISEHKKKHVKDGIKYLYKIIINND